MKIIFKLCLGPARGFVHVRRSDQREVIMFAISHVTPEFLKDVFELDAIPDFLKIQRSGVIVEIKQSNLVADQNYIIQGPKRMTMRERRKLREKTRTGNFQTCAIAILESFNPAPWWKFFFQMLFRLFHS